MREWFRARWHYVLGALSMAFLGALWVWDRAREAVADRRDTRTDRRLERAHSGHETHHARAIELERQAVEAERRADEIPTHSLDTSELTSDQVAAEFARIARERQ